MRIYSALVITILTLTITASSIIIVSALETTEVKFVNGPTECPNNEKVTLGKHLKIHKDGFIKDIPPGIPGREYKGMMIENTRIVGKTFNFQIGSAEAAPHVIKGIENGLIGQCKGATVILNIPPHEAYGEEGHNKIPPQATLQLKIFVEDVSDEPPLFTKLDTDNSGDISWEEMNAHFVRMGSGLSQAQWDKEDMNKDGVVSWMEFNGEKSSTPPLETPTTTDEKDEL